VSADRWDPTRAEAGGSPRVALDLRQVSVLPGEDCPGAGCPVEEVSLRCAAGSWTVLTGPPGSGPAEVLRVAAGLLPPTSGEVRAPLRRAHLGLVSPPWTTEPLVEALVEKAGGDHERVEELLVRLGLTRFRDRPLDRLDAPTRPPAALALALAGQPELLLAVDPTGNMDPEVADAGRALLREAADRTGLCVVTCEDSMAALAAADQVVLMARGRVVEVRTLPPATR
jgi:ABC-type sulfate/molybdate transport systems ATPase subunit